MYDPYANLPTSTPTVAQPRSDDSGPQRFASQVYPAGTVPRYRPVERHTNSIGTAGLVLALGGLVLCWVPIVGVLCGLLGAIFGGCGLKTGRRNGTPTGPAIGGLVLGLASLVPAVIIIVAVATA